MSPLWGLVLATWAAGPAFASTFVVNTTADTGAGSLRQALLDANASPGLDEIVFDIAGDGPHSIKPESALPEITDPVLVNGYSQGRSTGTTSDDAVENTAQRGTNAVLKIVLDFSAVTNSDHAGLAVRAGRSTIRGLVINGSQFGGISLGNLQCNNGDGNLIEGNFIGTDAAGNAAVGNAGTGIDLCSRSNLIGGTTPASRNLISGNAGGAGIAIGSVSNAAQGNRIEGNLIGTNAAGSAALPNGTGIFLRDRAGGNIVGGTAAGAGNLISGNSQDGILSGGSTANTAPGDSIQGNFIGTTANGMQALPNGGAGIHLSSVNNDSLIGGTTRGGRNVISGNSRSGIVVDASHTTIQGNLVGVDAAGTGALGNGETGILVLGTENTIGGADPVAGNVVAYNTAEGIYLGEASSTGHQILANSIYNNGRLGIDLWPQGPTPNDISDADTQVANRGQNFPVLTAATIASGMIGLSGTLNSEANTTFRIELFANTACDASGFGEGQTYLGTADVTTNGTGNATFGPLSFPLIEGQLSYTATATGPNGTSELSACISASMSPPPPSAQDTTPPTVASVDPNQGAVDGLRATDVLATFSKPLSAASVSNTTVRLYRLRRNEATAFAAAVSCGSPCRTITIHPSAALARNSTYEARISGGANGVTDVSGNPLATDYVWRFTTGR